MISPKPGDYGWGKVADGTVVFGLVKEATTVRSGWFKRTKLPVSVWDNNRNRVYAVDRLTEWHPLG